MEEKIFSIAGMSCGACSAAVERVTRRLPGVEKAEVSLMAERLFIVYDPGKCSVGDIKKAVKKAGFKASLLREEGNEDTKTGSLPGAKSRLWVSVVFLLPLMLLSWMQSGWLPRPGWLGGMTAGLLSLLLALPVAWVNRKFFLGGGKALFHLAPNMDSLVAVGAGAAYVVSLIRLFLMALSLDRGILPDSTSLPFSSGAMILTVVTLGKFLEERSKKSAGDALQHLRSLLPQTVRVLREGGEEEISLSLLQPGDILSLRPGERIPADGIILEGNTSADRSALTGESVPVGLVPGDSAEAGCVLLSGAIRLRVTRVGSDSALGKIITMVEQAGAGKAPSARLADKVAGVFVPCVMGLALLTLAGHLLAGNTLSQAGEYAAAVLLVSCPCALGLATPVAVTVAVGECSRHGILLKSAAIPEALAGIDSVFLDKTGTVTESLPSPERFCFLLPEEECRSIIALCEAQSNHPLAKALMHSLPAGEYPIPDSFKEIPGKGVEAKKDGIHYPAGNQEFFREKGIPLGQADVFAEEAEARGMTVIFFGKEKECAAAVALSAKRRVGADRLLESLHKMGARTTLLTGDSAGSAAHFAKELPLDEVAAGLTPEDKLERLRKAGQEGHKTLMVGDGINDAPALALANVGLAVGSGADIAADAADCVFLGDRVEEIASLLTYSRRVMRIIRQNLFWALFYNLLMIPIAAGAFSFCGIHMTPAMAAGAMCLSSLFVVTNARRLRKLWGKG